MMHQAFLLRAWPPLKHLPIPLIIPEWVPVGEIFRLKQTLGFEAFLKFFRCWRSRNEKEKKNLSRIRNRSRNPPWLFTVNKDTQQTNTTIPFICSHVNIRGGEVVHLTSSFFWPLGSFQLPVTSERFCDFFNPYVIGSKMTLLGGRWSSLTRTQHTG